MARFENEELGVSFTLPDEPTVRQQLRWRNARMRRGFSDPGATVYEVVWEDILPLVGEWACEIAPRPEEIDLDTATDPLIADLVTWVGLRVFTHFEKVEAVPKNS